jgi:hypothetical protein
MRKFFFILIGIISAGFALYFFTCSTVEMFKIKIPRSAVKVKTAKPIIGFSTLAGTIKGVMVIQ